MIPEHRALDVLGASLRFDTLEDYVNGYKPEEALLAISELETTREEMEAGIKSNCHDAYIYSAPSYYVNGTPVGKITKLLVRDREPGYVEKYKLARARTYLTLRDTAMKTEIFLKCLD